MALFDIVACSLSGRDPSDPKQMADYKEEARQRYERECYGPCYYAPRDDTRH